MRATLLLLAIAGLTAGCATFDDAYYLDREFGQASQASWDRQVRHPNYRYAGNIPEGAVIGDGVDVRQGSLLGAAAAERGDWASSP